MSSNELGIITVRARALPMKSLISVVFFLILLQHCLFLVTFIIFLFTRFIALHVFADATFGSIIEFLFLPRQLLFLLPPSPSQTRVKT